MLVRSNRFVQLALIILSPPDLGFASTSIAHCCSNIFDIVFKFDQNHLAALIEVLLLTEFWSVCKQRPGQSGGKGKR